MPALDFDNKTKEELEAIAAEEEAQAEEAQAEADVAVAKAKKEAEEAAAAKAAAEGAIAKRAAEEAGTPVGSKGLSELDKKWILTIAGPKGLTDKAFAALVAGPRPNGWTG